MRFWSDPTTKDAYRLSVAGILIEITAATLGIACFEVTGSSLALVFGLENIVDFLSSVVVLWRFFAPSETDAELEKKLASREERASVGISIILVFLGISVLVAAFGDYEAGQEDTGDLRPVIALAFFSILIFGFLTVLKFKYSSDLNSSSLYKDGVCSLIGIICSLGLFFNALIIQNNNSVYWIDPMVASIAGIAAILFGLHGVWVAMFVHKLPICSPSWWCTSKGSDDDTTCPQVEIKKVNETDIV